MDIEALSLLQDEKKELNRLPNITDPKVTFDSYEQIVGKTMTQTKKVIEKVSTYAKSIREELEDIRGLVQKCSIKIGEQIKELIKNYLLKDGFVFTKEPGKIPVTGKDIDHTKLQQVQTMQRLAEQQQKLMMFIAETEDLALKVESGADLAYSDITGMKGHLDQWCTCLETIEEKEKRIKEEREKGEDEKRKKEEKERRRKEQEEREAEEKRKRQEEEIKRRYWRNWPAFIYNNRRTNIFGQDICCVIFAYHDGIKKNDLQCEVSDMDNDMDKCLESNDEQIISSLITIKPTKAKC